MVDDRLNLEARFNDKASAGVKKLGKTLSEVKPTTGMVAAQRWMGDFRIAADKVHVAVRPLSGSLAALGVGGLAASMSMSELVKSFKGLADSTLQMRELARQSKMTATDIARLQYVATKFRIDPAAMDGAIEGWSDKMVEFQRHSGAFYTELLRQNSDVARKIAADSPIDALKDTLDFLSRIKDPQIQKRWAESMNLGGLVPALGKGPDGLAAAFADAGREVKPITQAMIDAADHLNESTARLNQSWANLKNDLGPSILDPLSHVLDRLDETLKAAGASPGDALAVAGVGVGGAAALYARHRMMRGSKLLGGGGLSAAAGELTGAAGALKQAAAALEASKAPGGPGGPGEPGKSGGSFDKGRALLAAAGLAGVAANAPGMDEAGDRERTANASALEALGEKLKEWTGASWLQAHNPFGGGSGGQPAAARELSEKVQEGSKAGIIAGLRELAQQQDLGGGKGGDGLAGGTMGTAARVLRNARTAAGAHFTAASGGGTTPARGALATHQREAYAAALKEGLSPTAARALVANMSGESLAQPNNYHWDRSHMSGGIVQWDPQRSAAIKAKFGDDPWKLSVAEQTRAAIWEMKSNPRFAPTWKSLQGQNGPEMLGALVDNYEAPADKGAAKAQRLGYYRGFNPDSNAPATAGAGSPAPSSAAISDAAVFAARQRILNGGRDAADRALVDRYKAQQNAPQAHASGGAIRGPGGPRSDSIFAMLSNGEFVVNARDAARHAPLLQAINSGGLPAFADGGLVAGRSRRNAWLSFFQRSAKDGGMGASRHVAFGATAMMMGESGRNLDPSLYGWDVNGPSGGTAQWHDVTKGPGAGKLHRLSDLMTMAMQQHADWHDVPVQQAWWKREAQGSMAYAWNAMRRAKTAAGALKAGIDRFEVPADKSLEFQRRLPNIMRLARETSGGPARVAHQLDPIEVNIRHHGNGRATVSGRAGKGVKLGIRSGPTMQPS